ncbi:MAG: 4-hydroxy-tetrahydrodipicolinate reductase, partial [Acidimicrobiales bacterium]
MTLRVGVLGAGGRMGAEACRAIAGDPTLTLAAAVDPHHAGDQAAGGVVISAGIDALADAGVEVAVHFTLADAARANLRWCAANGVHSVVGTSGLSDADLDELRSLFSADADGDGAGHGPNCLVAPNFAIGAVLMMRFAEMAAP